MTRWQKDTVFGPRNMGLDEDEIKNRVIEAADLVGLKGRCLKNLHLIFRGGKRRACHCSEL